MYPLDEISINMFTLIHESVGLHAHYIPKHVPTDRACMPEWWKPKHCNFCQTSNQDRSFCFRGRFEVHRTTNKQQLSVWCKPHGISKAIFIKLMKLNGPDLKESSQRYKLYNKFNSVYIAISQRNCMFSIQVLHPCMNGDSILSYTVCRLLCRHWKEAADL